MKTRYIFSYAFVLLTLSGYGQGVAINTDHTTADASAVLDVKSSTKGMLVPRMTSVQRTAIAAPAKGLLVFDNTTNSFWFYNGAAWTTIGGGGGTGVFTVTNGHVHNTGDTSTNHFVFGRTSIPKSNEGVEDKFLFFQKDKGALRAGAIASEDNNWAPENIGIHSVALGYNSIASANGSVALGGNNISSGPYSTSFGNFTKASGSYSIAFGSTTSAVGAGSFAGGIFSRASGMASAAFGDQIVSNSASSFVVGRYNDTLNGSANAWVDTDPIFMIGNGTSGASRRNAMTVLKNGFVGLGTSSPASLFHLKRNSSQGYGHLIVEETTDNADGGRITYKNSGSDYFWDLYGNTGIDLPGQARFNFNFTNPNPGGLSRDVLTLTGIGLVGVGNANPSAALDILSNASSGVPQLRARVNTADYSRLRMANTVHTNSYWDMASITSNTGTSTANMNFFYFHNNQGGSNILSLQGNGNATLFGTLTQNSDERLKKNITPIENPIDLLQQLSGYHYQWKDDWRDQATQTGLIAQEVEKAMPELVKEDEKGTKSVNYNGLIPYLLEAVKTLSEENKTMRKEIEQLKGK